MTRGKESRQGAMIRRVRLIAPADLSGRYEFPVRLAHDGRVYMVTVPLQGVQQGQSFVADATPFVRPTEHASEEKEDANDEDEIQFVTEEMAMAADPHHIPYGKFRDGLCSCTKNGWFHPSCWLACCCSGCVLGQVLWRLKLNAWGRPLPEENNSQWTSFQILTLVSFYYNVARYFIRSLSESYAVSAEEAEENDTKGRLHFSIALNIMSQVTTICFFTYIVITLCRTRRWIRHRYNIPGNACADCVCSCCCMCCVVCQLGRHTANYDEYPAYCCTDTGLARGAPEIV